VRTYSFVDFEGDIEELNALGAMGYHSGGDGIGETKTSAGFTLLCGVLERELDLEAYRYDGPSGPRFVKKVDEHGSLNTASPRLYWGVGDSGFFACNAMVPDDVDITRQGLLHGTKTIESGRSRSLVFLCFYDAERVARRSAAGLDIWVRDHDSGHGEE